MLTTSGCLFHRYLNTISPLMIISTNIFRTASQETKQLTVIPAKHPGVRLFCCGEILLGRCFVSAHSASIIVPVYYHICIPLFRKLFSLRNNLLDPSSVSTYLLIVIACNCNLLSIDTMYTYRVEKVYCLYNCIVSLHRKYLS